MITIEIMNSHTSSIHYNICNIMYNIIHKFYNTINYLTHEWRDYLLKFHFIVMFRPQIIDRELHNL